MTTNVDHELWEVTGPDDENGHFYIEGTARGVGWFCMELATRAELDHELAELGFTPDDLSRTQLAALKRAAAAEAALDHVYRCKCSWVGGDPDRHMGKNTCPACWHHDKRRVEVVDAGPVIP